MNVLKLEAYFLSTTWYISPAIIVVILWLLRQLYQLDIMLLSVLISVNQCYCCTVITLSRPPKMKVMSSSSHLSVCPFARFFKICLHRFLWIACGWNKWL